MSRRHSSATSDARKQSLYFPMEVLDEIRTEAERQDRSVSWIVQIAWRLAKKEIMAYPSAPQVD